MNFSQIMLDYFGLDQMACNRVIITNHYIVFHNLRHVVLLQHRGVCNGITAAHRWQTIMAVHTCMLVYCTLDVYASRMLVLHSFIDTGVFARQRCDM